MKSILHKISKLLSLTCAFACAASVTTQASAAEQEQPNVVVFLIDDMGWKDLACFGAELYETPNIDKLCGDGVRFSQAYTSAAICSPARASLLSGLNPLKLGMWNHTHHMAPREDFLPQKLKTAGYQNWHVGKWHAGSPKDKTMPKDIGFDVNVGGWTSWGPKSYFWPYGVKPGSDVPSGNTGVPGLTKGGQQGEFLTDRLTTEAVSLIENRKADQPFYLNMWYYSVHNKKEAKKELIEKYKKKIADKGTKAAYRHSELVDKNLITTEINAVYAAMIESLDDSVGRIVAQLKKDGSYDNTLFIFYSDNGPTTNDVPCAPLNGGKNTNYEGGIRVPAFAAWPSKIKAGSEYSNPVYICDIYSTVLEAAGQPLPSPSEKDSTSWFPIFEGNKLKPRQLCWYFPRSQTVYGGVASAAIYDENSQMKYIMSLVDNNDELYNIGEDLAETNNIIQQNPEVAENLRKNLHSFLKTNLPGSRAPASAQQKILEQKLGVSIKYNTSKK